MKLPINYEESHFTVRKLAREEYVRRQEGRCWYCSERLSDRPYKDVRAKKVNPALFPDSFFKWPVHLHHDHDSGMSIGAVHNHCNAVLWQYYGK